MLLFARNTESKYYTQSVNTFKLLQKDILFKHHSQKNKMPSELKYVLIDIIEKERKSKSFKIMEKAILKNYFAID